MIIDYVICLHRCGQHGFVCDTQADPHKSHHHAGLPLFAINCWWYVPGVDTALFGPMEIGDQPPYYRVI